MSDGNEIEAVERWKDPLSPLSRQHRKMALLTSGIAFAVSWADIVPTKISALGIEFSAANREALLVVLAMVIAYFSLSFVTYAVFDVKRWHYGVRDQENKRLGELSITSEHLGDEHARLYDRARGLSEELALLASELEYGLDLEFQDKEKHWVDPDKITWSSAPKGQEGLWERSQGVIFEYISVRDKMKGRASSIEAARKKTRMFHEFGVGSGEFLVRLVIDFFIPVAVSIVAVVSLITYDATVTAEQPKSRDPPVGQETPQT